jgi:polyhydroxyalkanoate synthesis repressor PhaR
MSAPRVIKKYPNRRLYDTSTSQYVTLEDLRSLVLKGEPLQVQDARNQKDLTRQVLLQIIAEQEDKGAPMFSAEFLSRVIRYYGDPMQGMVAGYLENSISAFLEHQEALKNQFNLLVKNAPASAFSEMAARQMEWWQAWQDGLRSKK